MIARPRSRSRRMRANSRCDVLLRERAGRLVEHQHAAAAPPRCGRSRRVAARPPTAAPPAHRAASPAGRPPPAPPGPARAARATAPAARASARRPAGCSPPPTGAAPATAPGRSSPRRPRGRRPATAGRYGSPSSSISPSSGASAPLSTFMSVLLPAPFSPTSACTSPPRTSRSTPPSARVAPNRWRTPRITNRGAEKLNRSSDRSRRDAAVR